MRDQAALIVFRDSLLGRGWRAAAAASHRAWTHSRARRLVVAGREGTGARERIRSGAVMVATASLTALVLSGAALPVEPYSWVVPVAALSLSVVVLAACGTRHR